MSTPKTEAHTPHQPNKNSSVISQLPFEVSVIPTDRTDLKNITFSNQATTSRNTSQLPLKLKIPHQETIYPPDKIILRKRKNSFDDNFTYEYKGPTNFYIHQFLVDLKRRKNKSLFRCFKNEKLFQFREKCDSLLKRKLPVWLVEAKGPLALNFDCIFLFLIMMGAALYFALKIEATEISLGRNHEEIYETIHNKGTLLTFIFTFYGLFFLSLSFRWMLAAFLTQTTIITLLNFFDLNFLAKNEESESSNVSLLTCRTALGLFGVFWIMVYPIYKILLNQGGRFISHIFVALTFIGIGLIVFGSLVLSVLSKTQTTAQIFEENEVMFTVTTGVLVSLSWITIHLKYFWVPSSTLEIALKHLSRKEMKKFTYKSLYKPKMEPEESDPTNKNTNNQSQNPLTQRIADNMYWISSTIIGGTFIAIEMFLAQSIILALKQENSKGLVTSLFFFAVIPIFTLIGISLALSKGHLKNKSLILPLAIMVPMLGAVPLADRFVEWGDSVRLSWYVVAGPPAACFFWLAMAFLELKRRRLFYGITTFSCVFFFIPIVFLGLEGSELFLSEKELFKKGSMILLMIGVIIILVILCSAIFLWISKLVKKKQKNNKIKRRATMSERKKSLMEESKKRTSVKQKVENKGFEDDIDASLDEDLEQLKNIHNSEKNAKNPQAEIQVKQASQTAPNFARESKRRSTFIDSNKDDSKRYRSVLWINLIYTNLKGFGYWINASAFIVSYTFIAYTVFNSSETATPNEKGTLVGVAIIMPGIFIANNMIIRMKSSKLTNYERKNLLTKQQLESKLYEADVARDNKRIKNASIIEVIVLIVGILLIPIMQIPLFFALENRQSRIANLVTMVASVFFSIFLAVMIEVKKRSGPYHKFFIPSFISLCWIFVVIPFVVCIPLLAILFNHDAEKFVSLIKGSLTGLAFLLMIGVTILAIVVNVFFQKLEEEKLVKFIVRYLQKILKQNAVSAGNDVVRRLVEYFRRKVTMTDMEQLKKDLIEDKFPIVPLYPPQFIPKDNYGAKLISFETHNRFLKIFSRKQLNPKFVKKKLNIFEKLLKCCGEEEEEDFDLNLNLDFEDGAFFRVDDYLPEDFTDQGPKWDETPLQEKPSDNQLEDRLEIENNDKEGISIDLQLRDEMTSKLEAINLRTLSPEEMRGLNRSEDGIRIQKESVELEIWYQHLYDYLSGRLKASDDNQSAGLIYQNFLQFIRIAQLSVSKEQAAIIYVKNARLKGSDNDCMSYLGFIQALNEISIIVFSDEVQGKKRLKLLTKHIFPQFTRIPEVSKRYNHIFGNLTNPYVPQLDLFESQAIPLLPLRVAQMDKDNDMNSNSGGSFEEKSPIDVRISIINKSLRSDFIDGSFVGSPKTPATYRMRKLQRQRESLNSSSFRQGSVLQELEDEITLGLDRTPNRDFVLDSEGIGNSFTLATQRYEAKLSKFGNTTNPEKIEAEKKVIIKTKRKNLAKILCTKILIVLSYCTNKIGRFWDYLINRGVIILTSFSDIVYQKTKGIGRAFGFTIEEEHEHIDREEQNVKRLTKIAPEWPTLVEKILKEITKAEELYFWKYHSKGIALMFNFANVLAIIGKFRDFYSYVVIAFSPEIPWFVNNNVSTLIQLPSWDAAYLNSFHTLFWLSLLLVGITVIFSIPAIYYLRQGRLGENKYGNKAHFPDPQFFLTIGLSTLAGSLFCQIMKSLLEAFVCDFNSEPWTLRRDPSIECLSDKHFLYMGMAAVAIILYYPISTFMFPNFQFQDKGLDLKYDPSFLVLNIQAKLLITGFLSFFKPRTPDDESGAVIKLVGSSTILIILALISLYMRPCLIKRINIWDIAFYSAGAWINLSGLFVLLTKKPLIGGLMIIAGVFLILLVTILVLRKYYKRKKKRKVHPVKPEQDYVRYDSLKRQAEIPEDIKQIKNMQLNNLPEGSLPERKRGTIRFTFQAIECGIEDTSDHKTDKRSETYKMF